MSLADPAALRLIIGETLYALPSEEVLRPASSFVAVETAEPVEQPAPVAEPPSPTPASTPEQAPVAPVAPAPAESEVQAAPQADAAPKPAKPEAAFTPPKPTLQQVEPPAQQAPAQLPQPQTPAPQPAPEAQQPATPAVAMPAPSQAANGLSFLGQNKGRIMLLVNHADTAFLTEAQYAFLNKILQAVKLDMDHVAVVNFHGNSTQAEADRINTFDCGTVISFGVQDNRLLVNSMCQPYGVLNIIGRQVLLADPLDAIAQDRDKKVKLWQALQQLFGKG